MDTRRLREPIRTAAAPSSEEVLEEAVEVIELRDVERRGRGLAGRLLFFAGIALLASLVAIAGLPSRTPIAFDTPLPNILATNDTP